MLKTATRVSKRFLADDKVFLSDLIRAEEKKSSDEAPYSKPVIREDVNSGQPIMVDPASYLLVPESQQISGDFLEVEYHTEIHELSEESKESDKDPFYNAKSTVYVDPCTAISLEPRDSLGGACLSLKISLPGLYSTATDSCRGLLSLLNRSRSKPVFLGKL